MSDRKIYDVQIPVTGIHVVYGVVAKDESEAIKLAMRQPIDIQNIECEQHRVVCQGFVFNGLLNEAVATLQDREGT